MAFQPWAFLIGLLRLAGVVLMIWKMKHEQRSEIIRSGILSFALLIRAAPKRPPSILRFAAEFRKNAPLSLNPWKLFGILPVVFFRAVLAEEMLFEQGR